MVFSVQCSSPTNIIEPMLCFWQNIPEVINISSNKVLLMVFLSSPLNWCRTIIFQYWQNILEIAVQCKHGQPLLPLKRVFCRGLELVLFFRTRFESVHPGKCVGKQVSPLGKIGRGPVPCSRCKPACRFRNFSVLPVTREDTWAPKTGAKTKPCFPSCVQELG